MAIRAGAIPALPNLNRAEGVTDSLDFDVRVFVRYSRAVTRDDLDRLGELGARDIVTFSSLPNYVAVTIPDPQLRKVRVLSGVTGIEPDLTGCFG